MSLFSLILDSIIPPRAGEKLVRNLCDEDLLTLTLPGTATLPYHDPRVTALVWEVKYRANKHAAALAGRFLALQLLAIAGEELGQLLLVPVPMHAERRKMRRYNQTELLCEAIIRQEIGGAEYRVDALKRIKATAPQQGLERQRRLSNVRNSMEANPSLVRDRVCVVVDDVTTTGATFEEAGRALLKAGARRVHFLPLAQS